MTRASSLLTSLTQPIGLDPRQLYMSAPQARASYDACRSDANDYWYAGLISLGEACIGIGAQRFSWATVKAYYSAFYLSRAALAFTGTAIEYLPWKGRFHHYVWASRAGQCPSKIAGNTHDSVLRYVDSQAVIPRLAGQYIGSQLVGDWLIGQRNSANYTGGRFPDPLPTQCLERIASTGVRQTLVAYAGDTSYLYTFDPDHAIISYPFELAKLLASAEPKQFEDSEMRHLDKLFRTPSGQLDFARSLYR
jgi:hypothetical protein